MCLSSLFTIKPSIKMADISLSDYDKCCWCLKSPFCLSTSLFVLKINEQLISLISPHLKILSFFFCELKLITVLFLICDSYTRLSVKFASLKACLGFSIFDSVLFSLKFIFLFNKNLRLFVFKTS